MSLVEDIIETRKTGKETDTTLKTDARVIARVTDGIYRQPGSALRELISNAYDADATEVAIDTDAPRFDKITVSDNGLGMSPKTLAYVLEHIGGSAKRTKHGTEYGVSSSKDPSLSPGRRKLIGKIGIGLFSVAQLSRDFQIITKIKGEKYRTIAAITLKSYSESDILESDDQDEYESGIVSIWSESASDAESHGTSIVITNLHPQTKSTLRSLDTWVAVEESRANETPLDPPQYHIGKVDLDKGETISSSPSLPYLSDDKPREKFKKLVDAVWKYSSGATSTPNLKLDQFYDYYFNMIWKLGLSIPAEYVGSHPFDLSVGDGISAYVLSNDMKKGSTAKQVKPSKNVNIRGALDLKTKSPATTFRVEIDGIRICRPIRFSGMPTTKNAIKSPLVFIGKCNQGFTNVAKEISTGALKFEAYLFWSPKISPRDHRGALVRINGASGTLFDDTFLKYQVAELQRLSQITCEIFISEGLDGALNIDRESFNYSHPHFVYLTSWLHSALRQLATTQKKVSAAVRKTTRQTAAASSVQRIREISEEHFKKAVSDQSAHPPDVKFQDNDLLFKENSGADTYVFPKEVVVPFGPKVKTDSAIQGSTIAEEKLRGIAQVLSAYGLLDSLSSSQQIDLLNAIASILAARDGE